MNPAAGFPTDRGATESRIGVTGEAHEEPSMPGVKPSRRGDAGASSTRKTEEKNTRKEDLRAASQGSENAKKNGRVTERERKTKKEKIVHTRSEQRKKGVKGEGCNWWIGGHSPEERARNHHDQPSL